jgi:hypothetical protein
MINITDLYYLKDHRSPTKKEYLIFSVDGDDFITLYGPQNNVNKRGAKVCGYTEAAKLATQKIKKGYTWLDHHSDDYDTAKASISDYFNVSQSMVRLPYELIMDATFPIETDPEPVFVENVPFDYDPAAFFDL